MWNRNSFQFIVFQFFKMYSIFLSFQLKDEDNETVEKKTTNHPLRVIMINIKNQSVEPTHVQFKYSV